MFSCCSIVKLILNFLIEIVRKCPWISTNTYPNCSCKITNWIKWNIWSLCLIFKSSKNCVSRPSHGSVRCFLWWPKTFFFFFTFGAWKQKKVLKMNPTIWSINITLWGFLGVTKPTSTSLNKTRKIKVYFFYYFPSLVYLVSTRNTLTFCFFIRQEHSTANKKIKKLNKKQREFSVMDRSCILP